MATRRTTTALLDKSGAIIYKSEWEARRADQDYWLLHKTESKSGHLVTAEWSGKIDNAHKIPKSKWAPWVLEVKFVSKFDENGAELGEPIVTRDELACDEFVTHEELMAAYNKFIQRYCGVKSVVTFGKGKDDPMPVVVEPPPSYPDDDDEEDDDHERDESGDYKGGETPDVPVAPADESADKVSGGMGGDW
jgi:hypothetical protein